MYKDNSVMKKSFFCQTMVEQLNINMQKMNFDSFLILYSKIMQNQT